MGPNPILGCLKSQTLQNYLYLLFFKAGKNRKQKEVCWNTWRKMNTTTQTNKMTKSSSTNDRTVVRNNCMHSTKFLDQMLTYSQN